MIINIRQFQDTGKTALAIITIKKLLEIGAKRADGYRQDDVVGNISFLDMPEAHSINNTSMKKYIGAMVTKGLKHKIILMDEADRLFPARFWNKPDQTETLIGLWQDYKLFNTIITTSHEGTGVDVILRSVAQIEMNPYYVPSEDRIYYRVYNATKGIKYTDHVDNVSRIFKSYDRWERVV